MKTMNLKLHSRFFFKLHCIVPVNAYSKHAGGAIQSHPKVLHKKMHSVIHLGRNKRKSNFEYIILRPRKVSSGPLPSIHTFYSIQRFC